MATQSVCIICLYTDLIDKYIYVFKQGVKSQWSKAMIFILFAVSENGTSIEIGGKEVIFACTKVTNVPVYQALGSCSYLIVRSRLKKDYLTW